MVVLTGQDSAKGETTKLKDKNHSDALQCGDKEKEDLTGDKLAYWRQYHGFENTKIKIQSKCKRTFKGDVTVYTIPIQKQSSNFYLVTFE